MKGGRSGPGAPPVAEGLWRAPPAIESLDVIAELNVRPSHRVTWNASLGLPAVRELSSVDAVK
jgi:hypothetical protein